MPSPAGETKRTEDMLKAGQKVVCIDGSPVRAAEGTALLRVVEGAIYTIRSIHTEAHIPEHYGVRLEELLNPSVVWSDGTECEWSYRSERFRPVVPLDDELREAMSAIQ